MQILEAEEEEKAEALANADPDEQITEQGGIFFPEIDLILWRRQKETGQPGEFEYLVKYKDYSYLHCEWLEESEVIGDSKAGKNKLNRFLKTFQKKQQEEVSRLLCFPQCTTDFGRILLGWIETININFRMQNNMKIKKNQEDESINFRMDENAFKQCQFQLDEQ